MKKFTKIISCVTAAVLTLGIAGCTEAPKTVYPDFINETEQNTNPVQTSEKYIINVLSEGGMKLDGVRVFAKRNGTTVKRAISSNGRIDLQISLGEYDLEVDETTLPAGYYLDGKTYKTSATSRDEVTIRIPSKLLGANETCGYRVGDIMKDFTFKDYESREYRLSDLLKTKKAVILNFWYVNCQYCRQEFPALHRAYSNMTDVEVLALNPIDDSERGSAYQQQEGFTFPMGEDRLGLSNSFNVQGYPTTVAIDRYGMITLIHSAGEPDMSYWVNLFNNLTSDNYAQNVTADGSGGEQSRPDAIKPTYQMPSSATLEQAANGDGFKATYRAEKNEYSWPWLAGEDDNGESYIYSSNKGVGDSYSMVYLTFDMKQSEVLSFEYNVDSEKGRDVLHVYVDGIIMTGEGWSATDQSVNGGWVNSNLYVADRDKTVEVAFTFIKDSADPEGFDKADNAKIRNIHLSDKSVITEPVDVFRTCADGLKEDGSSTRYEHYVTAVKGADGFYHKDAADGSIIYMAISNLTPWSDLHTGSYTQSEDGNSYYNTLYYMTYYNYSSGSESSFKITIDNTDVTSNVVTYWTLQSYMPSPYYLLPVNDALKDWATLFTKAFEEERNLTSHDDEWLEFCFYYDHVGADEGYSHGENGVCEAKIDRTRGLTRFNSYTAYEKHDTANLTSDLEMYTGTDGRFKAEMNYPMQPVNEVYFEFTAKETGVYKIHSYTKGCSSEGATPGLRVYTKDGGYYDAADEPRDHDAYKGLVEYEGFNHYLTLAANQTVYLAPTTFAGTTGHYEFDIEYLGATYKKMFIASTAGGMWGGNDGEVYLSVNAAYDQDTNCWYKADRQGNPNFEQPIYIDMVHSSCLYSDIPDSMSKSVEWLIEGGHFAQLKNGNVYDTKMREYLNKALQNDKPEEERLSEDDPMYGLVPADAYIVNALNALIDKYVYGGSGTGKGWMMFACYEEIFGAKN